MFHKKDKGFTLIELLVTILILSLTAIVGFIAVKSIMERSKEQSNELNIKSIVTSARSYTEEFKNEDKYWFIDNQADIEEYSCTTVGMLINKGFLKESILNTIIDEKNVTKDTSVLIKRDINTKVNNDTDIIFNSASCNEDASIKVNFSILSEVEETGWFINDVNIKIVIENSSQINREDTTYFVKENHNVKDAIISEKKGNEGQNWDVKVGNEGVNLDLCINVVTLKDKTLSYCLSETTNKYKMDKTKPNIPTLALIAENNNYNIISSNASDNITSNNDLKYYITYDETLNEKEHLLDGKIRINNKEVSTYVVDEAGNKSDVVTKILNIDDSKNANTISKTEYYCSLDSNIYTNENDASSNCSKLTIGTVSSDIYYTCSYNNTKYSTYDSAYTNCTKTTTGTITEKPHTTTEKTTVSGSCTYSLLCTDGAWYSTNHACTNNGCPSGYSKVDWSCGDPGLGTSPCSTAGATSSKTVSCTNYCSKSTTTYTYYCSLGYNVSGFYSNCSKTTRGDVSNKTRYYCDLNNSIYDDNSDAINSCKETENGTVSNKTKYTCPLNNTDYDENDLATNACTNYCSSGTYYNNSCYSFN